MYTRRFENYCFQPLSTDCVYLRKKAVAVEVSCTYSAVYVLSRRWNKSCYLLVMFYYLLNCSFSEHFYPQLIRLLGYLMRVYW